MVNKATRRGFMLGTLAAAALLGGCAGMGLGPAKERVVIQVSDGDPKIWNQAINVVNNVKSAYVKRGADVEISLVAFGAGIQMLKDDAVVANRVRDTMKSGAQMVACENSMNRFKLTKTAMVENVTYAEAGVLYIIEQHRAGSTVIRP